MKLRLGMWNRLAVVATGLALLIAPIAIMVDIQSDVDKAREAYFELCMDMAAKVPVADAAKARDNCWKDRFPKPDYSRQGWSHWREYALGTLEACGILYAMIWAIVATIKWVWRGRAIGKSSDPIV